MPKGVYKRKPFSEQHRKNMSIAQKKNEKSHFKKGHKTNVGRKEPKEITVKRIAKITGKKNVAWKGSKANYSTIHEWVYRNYGRPTTCEHCKKTGLTGYKINWANKDRKYSRNRESWIRLCTMCHMLFDKSKNFRK